MFEKGIGVGKDEKEAVVWYGKSASQGNSAAQFNLAVLFENGRGTKVDFAKANKWYRKAAVQGDALAIGNLGMLYVRGQGVKEDKVAGVALLIVSATSDPSPENHARRNITATRGLTSEMIVAAQTLAGELNKAKNLLVPLDQHLKQSEKGQRRNRHRAVIANRHSTTRKTPTVMAGTENPESFVHSNSSSEIKFFNPVALIR